MKKIISILIIFILSFQLNAQIHSKKIKGNGEITSVTRTVNNYHKIGVAGSFNVKLFKGKEGDIIVKADGNLMDYIITEVENGVLEIKLKKGFILKSTNTIEISVPFEDVEAISLAGSGNIDSKDLLNPTSLKLSIAGSGTIDMPISVKNLTSKIAGSGKITINGDCIDCNYSITGSGIINGYNLNAELSNIKITGSGIVTVNAVNEIHSKITGSGNVTYTGNPTIEKSSSIGSGTMKKKS